MSSPSQPVPALHALEAEAMNTVWDLGETSVREVMDTLNRAAPKSRAYTTYMTILGRLSAKGLLARRRQGKTDFFTPVYSRAEYAELRAGAEVEALVDTFGDVALSQFARHMAELEPQRRDALEQLARAH